MKRLFLLRHAQARSGEGGNDIDRALAPAGLAEARALGQIMHQKGYAPDMILCSPALRTRQTLEGVLQTVQTASTIYPPRLYDGSRGDVFAMIQHAEDSVKNLLVVGHNPVIHELAAMLASENSAASLIGKLASGYKPATLCVLGVDLKTWSDLQPGEAILTDYLDPLDYDAPAGPTRWM